MNRSPVERHRAACTAGAHYAWDYLRQHVLEDLSAQESELLQLASMFDVVIPRRCDELHGAADAAQPVLHELGRRSLLSDDDVAG